MIKSEEDLKHISPVGGVYYLQEFIDSKKKNIYYDIRVLVSNHKIVS